MNGVSKTSNCYTHTWKNALSLLPLLLLCQWLWWFMTYLPYAVDELPLVYTLSPSFNYGNDI
jgi:hypothetical protein